MTSVNDWYSHFLAKRSIPLKREIVLNTPTEGFALSVKKLHLTKLHPDAKYRINAYFYDSRTAQLFGCPYHSEWIKPVHHECTFNELIFFHCPRVDDNILLILEIVEDLKNTKVDLRTISWGMISILATNEPIPLFGLTPDNMKAKKLHLHPGSPKVLIFMTRLEADAATSGTIEYMLYSHPNLSEAFDFFPDFCIVGYKDEIPGLQHTNGKLTLANPVTLPEVPATLNEIGLSFGPYADRLEQLILEEVNTERMNLENKKNTNIAEPMCVLERRLRIGVHNGYTFLFEPMMVHLSSIDEHIIGTHSLRRKGRPLSRSSTDIRTELNTLFVRSKVSVPCLYDDPRITLVFALDYLLGVRTKNNNISSHTQSIIICWGAWKPFTDKSIFQQGQTQANVCLLGGSRPNPEESLCFENLTYLYRRDDSVLTETAPKIFIRFNFALDDAISHPASGHSSRLAMSREYLNNLPGDEEIDTPLPHHEHIPSTDVTDNIEVEKELLSAKTISKAIPLSQEKLPSILVKKPAIKTTQDFSKSIEKAFEDDDVVSSSPRDNVPIIFDIPWRESKVSNMHRVMMASAANEKFAKVLDREGDAPTLVDVGSLAPFNQAVEENDRLDINEIVVQFLYYKYLNRPDASSPRRIFFTLTFYRFSEITTEELLISDCGNPNEASILRRLTENDGESGNELPPGFLIKYIIDRQSSKFSSIDEFLSYLHNEHLVIDVWDSQSLILQGTARIPLKCLLRNGNEAVQCMIQCPVVCSAISDQKNQMAILYLKIANIGHPSSNQIDMVYSRTTALVTRRLRRIGEESVDTYRILAKPLNPIHQDALQRFMHAQRLDIQQRYENIFNEDMHDRLREWERLKSAIPLTAQKQMFKKFIFDEQLEAYRKLRNESKAAKLLQAVFQGITLQHHLVVSLGESHFFEYLLQNTFPDPINCVIIIDHPGLKVVIDEEEWSFYKKQNSLTTPLEKNMFHASKNGNFEVFLKPMESIYVPFLYEHFNISKHDDVNETKVLFRRWDNGEPVSILDLRLDQRPSCVHQTIRFYSESATQFQRNLLISGLKGNRRVLALRSVDPTVKVALRNRGVEQELVISAFCGEPGSSRVIPIILYGDSHMYRLLSIWRIVVHSLERKDIHSTLGQAVKLSLTIRRSDTSNQLIQVFSNARSLRPVSEQPYLTSNEVVQLPMTYNPDYQGRRIHVVTAVDTSSRNLLHSWIVHSKSEPPIITKRFDVKIDLNEKKLISKRLPIYNSYSIPRIFQISCSRPDLVTPETDNLTIQPNQSHPLVVHFHNVISRPITIEILIFIHNSETGQQEETFALNVIYYY